MKRSFIVVTISSLLLLGACVASNSNSEADIPKRFQLLSHEKHIVSHQPSMSFSVIQDSKTGRCYLLASTNNGTGVTPIIC